MPKHCPLCQSTENKIIFKEIDADILKCLACGHVFSSFERPADYGGYFGEEITDDLSSFWWRDAHQKMYSRFIAKYLKGRTGKLLDFGCGFGYFVEAVGQIPGWKVQGCDTSRTACDYASKKLGLKNIHCGSIETLELPGNFFDIITLWDAIEHIPFPQNLLSQILNLLKPGGLILIHTPNVKIQLPKAKIKKILFGLRPDGHFMEAKDHLNIYSRTALKNLLEKHSFSQIQFINLPPIQAVSGSNSRLGRFIKNLWFGLAVLINKISLGNIYLNNLTMIAKK